MKKMRGKGRDEILLLLYTYEVWIAMIFFAYYSIEFKDHSETLRVSALQ